MWKGKLAWLKFDKIVEFHFHSFDAHNSHLHLNSMQFYKIKNERGIDDDEENGQMDGRKNGHQTNNGPIRGTKVSQISN